MNARIAIPAASRETMFFEYAKTKTQIRCYFRYTDSTLTVLSKSEISTLLSFSALVHETPEDRFSRDAAQTDRCQSPVIFVYQIGVVNSSGF